MRRQAETAIRRPAVTQGRALKREAKSALDFTRRLNLWQDKRGAGRQHEIEPKDARRQRPPAMRIGVGIGPEFNLAEVAVAVELGQISNVVDPRLG